MSASVRSTYVPKVSINFFLLTALLVMIWVAGGASRADALGQVLVRAVAWMTIVGTTVLGPRPALTAVRPVLIILAAALLLVALQLVPLPAAIWRALPGRTELADMATLIGQPPTWRPMAIVPGAALNAMSSLVVPFAVLLLVAGLSENETAWLPGLVFGLIASSAVIGLLQFSGAGISNPFINDSPGQVSGNLANRNHFALLLALGCLIAPIWALFNKPSMSWRIPAAAGFVLVFVLLILGSGSRAGIVVGILALGIDLLLIRNCLKSRGRQVSRWIFPAIVGVTVATIGIFAAVSIMANRAISVGRLFDTASGEDLRTRTMPTVIDMIRTYFPAGSGFGGFDPIFRIHEPFRLLKPTYFNHAHNDYLEVALDGGLLGILLLVAAIAWWLRASVAAWRGGSALAKLGSAMIGLIFIAELFDYPARTPIIMTIIIIAGAWLVDRRHRSARMPLPAATG